MPIMFPLARPIRHPVHWQAGFSKSQGLPANVSFLPLPLPPPPHIFNFLSLGPFFAWPKHYFCSKVVVCTETTRKHLLHRLLSNIWNSPDKHLLCKIKNNKIVYRLYMTVIILGDVLLSHHLPQT